jgi:hypothetical protein
MNMLLRSAGVAAVAAAAWMTTAAPTPATASPQEALTQELSARCRTVVTYRWSYGRRVAVRKSVCSPSYSYYRRPYYASCRTVVKTRWQNGRRVSVRTRVC